MSWSSHRMTKSAHNRDQMTPQHDIVLEIGYAFTRCLCGGRVRLYRDDDGDLSVEHAGGHEHTCVHRNAIILGVTQLMRADSSHKN